MRSYGLRAGAGGSRLADRHPAGQRAKPMPANASGGLEANLQLMLIDRASHHIHFQPGLASGVRTETDHHEAAVLQLEAELPQVGPHVGTADGPAPE